MLAGRRTRERAGSQGRVTSSFRRRAAVAGETPRAADEDTDADALALGISQPFDASVLRRDELVALPDDARVGIFSPRAARGVDGS